MAAALASGVLRHLLGTACAACREVIHGPSAGSVCVDCWRQALAGGPLPGERDARGAWVPGSRLAAWRSVGIYGGTLRRIILAFKYGGHRDLGPVLGALMRDAGVDLLNGAVAVVPVPLWAPRRRARGFNQADELAQALGLPVWRALRRCRPGLPQAALSAPARAANVADAYALSFTMSVAHWLRPLIGVEELPSLGGSTVVLVDDVMATGATLESCAAVLRRAGAREVRALVAARAVRRDRADLPVPRSPTRIRLATPPQPGGAFGAANNHSNLRT